MGRRWLCAWRLGIWLFDIVTVIWCIADGVTDTLVLVDYYVNGRRAFFSISLAILLTSHCTYCWLMIELWCSRFSLLKRCVIFAALLPVAQIIPILMYVEALHLPRVDRFLGRIGLTPSERVSIAAPSTVYGASAKLLALHAGFLIEALVEAVPQSTLQVVAVVTSGDASALELLSIFLSITVVVSKCWILGLTQEVTSTIFNSLAFAADGLLLFASATWLSVRTPSTHPDSAFEAAISGLVVGGMLLLCTAFLLLELCDFLLQVLSFRNHCWAPPKFATARYRDGLRFWGLWMAALLFATVPATVVLLTIKVSLLPLCFSTLDFAPVAHRPLLVKLSKFIKTSGESAPSSSAVVADTIDGPSERLKVVGNLLCSAKRYQEALASIRQSQGLDVTESGRVAWRMDRELNNRGYDRGFGPDESGPERAQAVRVWLAQLRQWDSHSSRSNTIEGILANFGELGCRAAVAAQEESVQDKAVNRSHIPTNHQLEDDDRRVRRSQCRQTLEGVGKRRCLAYIAEHGVCGTMGHLFPHFEMVNELETPSEEIRANEADGPLDPEIRWTPQEMADRSIVFRTLIEHPTEAVVSALRQSRISRVARRCLLAVGIPLYFIEVSLMYCNVLGFFVSVLHGVLYPLIQACITARESLGHIGVIPRVLTSVYALCCIGVIGLLPSVLRMRRTSRVEGKTIRHLIADKLEALPDAVILFGGEALVDDCRNRLEILVRDKELFEVLLRRTNAHCAARVMTFLR